MDVSRSSSLKTSCLVKARLVFSIIGVFVGVSACFTFSIHYKNYNTGIWGLCSGMAALVALCVTVAYMRGAWDANPLPLKGFMLCGCFIQLAGVCGFVAYLVLAISQHQGLVVYGLGFYPSAVWCFMTWKWGFLLFIYSRAYYRAYISDGILVVDAEGGVARSYKSMEGSNS